MLQMAGAMGQVVGALVVEALEVGLEVAVVAVAGVAMAAPEEMVARWVVVLVVDVGL